MGLDLKQAAHILGTLEPLTCVVALSVLFVGGHSKRFKVLTTYISVRLINWAVCTFLIKASFISLQTAYTIYFWVYWSAFVIEALLSLGIVYELYQLAMAPLPGLQRLGSLMFRWAAGIAAIIAFGLALGPHASGTSFVVKSVFQLQQTQSILTLCLLLFVTFAIRPMGLGFRSRIFGVSLGLGVLASADLLSSAWLSHVASFGSVLNVCMGVAYLVAVSIWVAYFALPEPKRQMIILPTTSPFLRWNQISLALGDSPGYVAVGGIDPSFLAPAEVEIMVRASIKMDAMAAEA